MFYTLHFFVLFAPIFAALNESACYGRDCIAQNAVGAWCFFPKPLHPPSASCTGGLASELLFESAMQTHINNSAGFSIAYYDLDNNFLGAATWPVPPAADLVYPIFLCMTGQASDDQSYKTICRFSTHDNDMEDLDKEQNYCATSLAQEFVSDGCYAVHSPRGDDNTTISSSTTNSTAMSSSSSSTKSETRFVVAGSIAGAVASFIAVLSYLKYKPLVARIREIMRYFRSRHKRENQDVELPEGGTLDSSNSGQKNIPSEVSTVESAS